ncbi:hypothetical protein B0J17DRAFT_56198 [Rhizoctonia solani]|nr:hypothetical protein B0J17DRAFT_56198 [Rhizoctonia solani]
MFDSQVHAELSQHLFDIQMAKYIRGGLNRTDIISREGVTSQPTNPTCVTDHANEESTKTTNNAGTGADIAGLYQSTQVSQDRAIHAAIERSNQITEQANQLVERSNQLVERFNRIADQSNQLLAERSSLSAEQSNRFAERFNELLERLTQHSELSNQNSMQFNQLMGELVKPVAKFENILGNINRVLVGIQHAIVRNHKGNTTSALECLVNEKGETQAVSRTTEHTSYQWFSERYTNSAHSLLPVTIDGVCHDSYIHNAWLGDFLRFYGIGEGICEDDMSSNLKGGMKQDARKRLRNYLSSCLG